MFEKEEKVDFPHKAYPEKDIVCLGTQYRLASKYTSFVTVDSTMQAPPSTTRSALAAMFASGSPSTGLVYQNS
ncbi:hypothetical protein BDP27DRAFT_1417148 [Rhodocollybia butyracea]|uniref:Uncharacterized protein n=1 Tax=Rhodocollybia butyracea TaxID=206335 RepID=A0A9P5UCM8_9AGAR|nr:hypothetical protein BDP27DRAFT_1417148 [Rhodocollybia butyracea]